MKEVLTIDRINSLIRIPKRWIDEHIPPSDKVQILREMDGERIIITPIQPQTKGSRNGSTKNSRS